MFDNLYLLSEGEVVYFGASVRAFEYFSKQGFTCPPNVTISDFALDVVSMDYRSKEAEKESRERIKLYAGKRQ